MQTKEDKGKDREGKVERAKAILRGRHEDAPECLQLAKKLKDYGEMRWARRLLDHTVALGVSDPKLAKKIAQTRALVTYKDSQLGRDEALNKALDILATTFDLASETEQEVLGLVGAIYKRKWEVDADKIELEQSLRYYRRGYEVGVDKDDGYTAINAAFVLDLLAHIEETQAHEAGTTALHADGRRHDANTIRQQIVAVLKPKYANREAASLTRYDYWPLATLAEAQFGLKQYDNASATLRLAKAVADVPEWEFLSTAKQLAHLSQIQADHVLTDVELEKSAAWQALYEFLGEKATAVRTMFLGKMGLALSGGGFRASLYHIGVLAKLAELDLLRHVEVLSCVSGGSIIGAHYYLELRRLFMKEKLKDDAFTRDEYVKLVKRMADDFLVGVQQNPRMRILANPITNIRLLFSTAYSRTQRLGELYEKLIYSRIKDGEGDKPRWLNGLFITPPEYDEKKFVPRQHNWMRQAKVPELVLNATTLNSGHNWQFTASWMGESPVSIRREVDTNTRYRRMYYDEAPPRYKNMRLGYAVGASSCVPGLFEPLIFPNLYPDTIIRLVDGGVYDNQGTASLLEQDCNVILVSDATGQMSTEDDPGGGVLKPLLRTNSVMMHRIRDAQYKDLQARERSALLRGFMYVHMKQGLDGTNKAWERCEEPEEISLEPPSVVTPYGIRKDIQALVANIRTDLDSFSQREAYALMVSGYRATEASISGLKGFRLSKQPAPEWRFLQVEEGMTKINSESAEYDTMKKHLQAAQMTFFKVWKISPPLTITAYGLLALLVAGLLWTWHAYPAYSPLASLFNYLRELLTINFMMTTLVLLLVYTVLASFIGKRNAKHVKALAHLSDTLKRMGVALGIGIVGWIGAQIHLRIFDRLFLRLGRVKTTTEKST